jgi:hypothetical protein
MWAFARLTVHSVGCFSLCSRAVYYGAWSWSHLTRSPPSSPLPRLPTKITRPHDWVWRLGLASDPAPLTASVPDFAVGTIGGGFERDRLFCS